MRDLRIQDSLRRWLPAAAGIAAVAGAAALAVDRSRSTERRIAEVVTLADRLNDAASIVCASTAPPDESRKDLALQDDLRRRIREACMPGLVQAELMSTARKAALDVKEIQPVAPAMGLRGAENQATNPAYRVQVIGSYRQIADYMELCKRQRLPARVIGFRISRMNGEDGRPLPALTADITVEAYLPPADAVELAKG